MAIVIKGPEGGLMPKKYTEVRRLILFVILLTQFKKIIHQMCEAMKRI